MALELKRKRNRLAYRPSDAILAPILKEFEDLLNNNVLSPSGQEPTAGEMLFWSDTGTMTGLEIGATDRFLTVASGLPAWSTWSLPTSIGSDGEILHVTSGAADWTTTFTGAYTFTNAGIPITISDPDTTGSNVALDIVSDTDGAILARITNNSTGNAVLQLKTGGPASTGDTLIQFDVSGGATQWSVGIDNSASDAFVLSASTTLGTSNALAFQTTLAAEAYGAWTFSAAGTALTVTNDALISGNLTVSGWGRFGTATDTATAGDLVFGLTGAARGFYDQSAALMAFYTATNTLSTQISAVASTNTVFNETGLDIDHRWEAVGQANLVVYDGGLAAIGFGKVPIASRFIDATKSYTATSGNQFGVFLDVNTSGLAANSTAWVIAQRNLARHQVAFDLTRSTGALIEADTTSGFSAGTLADFESIRCVLTHAGAGAVTTAYGIRVLQTLTGAGTIATYNQLLLTDLTGGTVTTRIAIRQQGTNAHNRFQGGATFGADATMTNSATVDIQGSLGVGAHGTTLATGDAAFGTGTSARLWWDVSALTLLQYGTGAAIFNQFSSVAGTANVLNEASADIDTRIESNGDENCLFVDGGNDNVGIGTGTPSAGYKLEVNGKIRTQDVIDFSYALTAADTNVPTTINTPTGVAAAQSGWLKIEVEGATKYLQVWG